jgi:hypothetical protein
MMPARSAWRSNKLLRSQTYDSIRAWASVGALFSEYYPIGLEPRTLIRCFEAEGIDRRQATAIAGDSGMTKLELLYAQKSEKFGEVCAVAARELGYAELSTLSVEDRIRVEDEARLYVEKWEETVEMRTNFTIRPVTPMRHLLAEYHDICERILDEHEIVAGLLAYRQRAQKRRRPASL